MRVNEIITEATDNRGFNSMMGRIKNDPWTQLNSDPNWESEIEELVNQHIEPWLLAMERANMPITKDNDTLNPGWRKRYEQVSTQLAQKFLTSRRFNPRDPDLVNKIRAYIDWYTNESNSVHGQLSAYATDLPLQLYLDTPAADEKIADIRAAMFSNDQDEVDDDGYATRPRPEADPRRLDPGNMEEAQDWQGNRGAGQAEATDHTMDEAIEYVKGNYPFAKTYRVRRAEPGFRANRDPDQYNRSNAHVTDVDSAMDYLQLRENPVMSGSKQISHSLGYSWHTNENRGSGIAVFYYEDRGMGWDEIIVAAKDKKNLAAAVQVFRDAGVVPTPKPRAAE